MKQTLTLYLAFLLFPLLLQSQNINEGAASARLINQVQDSPQEKHLVYVLLSDYVDATEMGKQFEQSKLPVRERVTTLITALKQKADETQPEIINYLRSLDGVAEPSIKPFWVTNTIFVEANAIAIAALSNHPKIYWMDVNAENALSEYEEVDCAMPPVPNGIEPGLQVINAPALWAMGYTGYGQIGFTADTGIDPWHPAISLKYQGLYSNADETWASFNNNGTVNSNTTPVNCGDHGNHTTGTMLGLDRMTNDTIGVAYGANWVGANILCGIGTADNIGAFQWALDPDGNSSTTADMPDVINNSWRDGSLQGADCNSVYVQVLSALEAAGIANVFSAGNEGPEASTITAPHNINTDTLNSFTVGALNGNVSSLPITNFSSIGPSSCSGSGSLLIKPEVSAPGQQVRSCTLDGSYGSKNGTSMAAPHVSGAVLLLKEAFPELTGKDLLRVIYHTCTDLGEVGEDNTYGMGVINVLEAFNSLVDQGNVPVSPYVETDALLVGFSSTGGYCAAIYTEEIFFENAGTTNLTSLDVLVTITNETSGIPISIPFSWTGDLASKERASVVIPETAMENGSYVLEVELLNPNGIVDQKPLNNKGIKRFDLYASDDYDIYLGGINNAAPCLGASALLYSDYEGDGLIRWYSSLTGSNPVGEGNTYVTSILNTDRTYYTELVKASYIGEADLDPQTEETDIVDGGIIFDADFPFTIKSIKIYPEFTGSRYIELYSSDGELIESIQLAAFNPGEQRMEIDLEVPVGEDMELRLGDAGFGLPYSGGASYPYQIGEDLGTIKGSSHPSMSADAWFYFYDWEIENPNYCGRKSIDVDIVADTDVPTAQFSTSADVVDFGNNESVLFDNESENATEWLWDFGDGNTTTSESPAHLYQEEGVYTVSLSVIGAGICSDSYSKTVTIQTLVGDKEPEELEGKVTVFPNPVSDLIHVQYEFEEAQALELKVMDALGRTVHELSERTYAKGEQLIDTRTWPNGMYYMVFTNGKASLVKKLVRLGVK